MPTHNKRMFFCGQRGKSQTERLGLWKTCSFCRVRRAKEALKSNPPPTISLNFTVEILNVSFFNVCLGFGGSFPEAVQSARVIKVEDSLGLSRVIGRIRSCHILSCTDPTSEN